MDKTRRARDGLPVFCPGTEKGAVLQPPQQIQHITEDSGCQRISDPKPHFLPFAKNRPCHFGNYPKLIFPDIHVIL